MIECMKSELDIFRTQPIQSSILRSEEVSYNPIASLDNPSVIEFVSLGHGDTYRDLSSAYLKLKVQFLKKIHPYSFSIKPHKLSKKAKKKKILKKYHLHKKVKKICY